MERDNSARGLWRQENAEVKSKYNKTAPHSRKLSEHRNRKKYTDIYGVYGCKSTK